MSTAKDDPLSELGAQAVEPAEDWKPGISEQPRKKGLPRWLRWGCGCGCLGMVMLAVAMVGGTYLLTKDSTDPEVQWARLGEHLTFDERPTDLTLKFGMRMPTVKFFVDLMPGTEEYHLSDSADGYGVIVRIIRTEEMLAQFMDPDGNLPGVGVEGGELFSLSLQGREVEAMRFEGSNTEIPFITEEMRKSIDTGPGVRVLIPRAEKSLIVELRYQSIALNDARKQLDDILQGSLPGESEAVPESELDAFSGMNEMLVDFFDHFELWN